MNMFDAAKAAPKKVATKKAAKEKAEVTIVGLEELAVIKTVSKALEGLSDSLESEVKEQIASAFVQTSNGKKPENFRGVENDASASCELRKRSSRSVLSVDEQALLAEYNISTEIVEDVTEAFVINPKYKDDQALLSKVSTALGKVNGMPEDFIVHQAQEARVVTTATSLDEVFANPNAEVVAQLLKVVGTLAIKPVLNTTDISTALAKLDAILNPVVDDE